MKRIGLMILAVFLVGSFFLDLTATAKTNFKDVPANHWANEDVTYLFEKKVINGYSNEIFGPDDSIKRVDAARMIVRALDLDTSNRPIPDLKDITTKSDGYDFIATVIDEGIFNGNNGFFYPDNNLTRAEMAAVLKRTFQLEDKNKNVTFKDLKSSHWAYKDIKTLASNDLTQGYEDKTFRPDQTITRAEFSTLMTRVLKDPNIMKNLDPKDKSPEEKKEDDKEDPKEKENEQPFQVIDIN